VLVLVLVVLLVVVPGVVVLVVVPGCERLGHGSSGAGHQFLHR
jgi:hypothetical protein